jgi:hypothetical protein
MLSPPETEAYKVYPESMPVLGLSCKQQMNTLGTFTTFSIESMCMKRHQPTALWCSSCLLPDVCRLAKGFYWERLLYADLHALSNGAVWYTINIAQLLKAANRSIVLRRAFKLESSPHFADIMLCTGVATICISLPEMFQAPKYRTLRALLFICLGGWGIVPVAHQWLFYWDIYAIRTAFTLDLCMGATYLVRGKTKHGSGLTVACCCSLHLCESWSCMQYACLCRLIEGFVRVCLFCKKPYEPEIIRATRKNEEHVLSGHCRADWVYMRGIQCMAFCV